MVEKKQMPTGLNELRTRANYRWRFRNMLQHLEAGNNIEATWAFGSKFFSRGLSIVNVDAGLNLVQAGYGERPFGHINAGHRSAGARHCLGKDSATAADINDGAAIEFGILPDPVQP